MSASQNIPRVSIVIPAYNCAKFIEETVASIQSQTFADWECIIVDDGSRDATLEVIRGLATADARISTATQQNAGPASARNNGLAITDARSAYIVFMDSDDVWFPEALATLIAKLEAHPEAVGVHALGRNIDQDGTVYEDPAYKSNGQGRFVCDARGRIMEFTDSEPTTFRSLWFSNPYPPGLIIAHRRWYEKVGPFDGSLCPMEDWDILIRMSRFGDFRFLPTVILSYRRHGNNLSSRSVDINGRQVRNILRKTFFSAENNPEQRIIVRQNWRASEMLHLNQKWENAEKQFGKGHAGGALSSAAAGLVHLWRWTRGCPTAELVNLSIEEVRQ
jgi:glycosyltransferase involved in cell wall biosynthesis